ncbi:serine hydrolase [Acidiphilium sp. AL]|uniref:serine hydrolase n=1 Tax=Acidiphilium iwatense TaxID=768198 RepID=UPI0022A6FC2D|nr:serine hydrolase [Acidiphilium iwatense]MCU4158757.1 serine hydrolase [Acidiphilium sp. AL]
MVETRLFPALGLTGSYIDVPPGRMEDYAQGHTQAGAPIRMRPGVLAVEAYGVRARAADLIRLVDANMRPGNLDGIWRRPIAATHRGYFRSGPLIQDLIWEQYPWPVTLSRVLAGNSDRMIYQATAASRLAPPLRPETAALINKTGTTNGFSAYLAFVPATRVGIVMLANRNYPTPPKVDAAYRILTRLGAEP